MWPGKAAKVETDKGCEGYQAAVAEKPQERRRFDQASAISLNDRSVLGRDTKAMYMSSKETGSSSRGVHGEEMLEKVKL